MKFFLFKPQNFFFCLSSLRLFVEGRKKHWIERLKQTEKILCWKEKKGKGKREQVILQNFTQLFVLCPVQSVLQSSYISRTWLITLHVWLLLFPYFLRFYLNKLIQKNISGKSELEWVLSVENWNLKKEIFRDTQSNYFSLSFIAVKKTSSTINFWSTFFICYK